MERWMLRDPMTLFSRITPALRPGSRSNLRLKVDAIGQLLVRLQWNTGDSAEETADVLRALATLANSAADDLCPTDG